MLPLCAAIFFYHTDHNDGSNDGVDSDSDDNDNGNGNSGLSIPIIILFAIFSVLDVVVSVSFSTCNILLNTCTFVLFNAAVL